MSGSDFVFAPIQKRKEERNSSLSHNNILLAIEIHIIHIIHITYKKLRHLGRKQRKKMQEYIVTKI